MLTVRPLLVRVLFIRRKKFLSLDCLANGFLVEPESSVMTKLKQFINFNIYHSLKNKQTNMEMNSFTSTEPTFVGIITGGLTWTWSQQVSELLLIAGMNKFIDTLTQQLQL